MMSSLLTTDVGYISTWMGYSLSSRPGIDSVQHKSTICTKVLNTANIKNSYKKVADQLGW